MTRILVTGGAGYIGSIIVEMLLKNNYQVTVADNFHYNQFSALNHLIGNSKLDILKTDIRDSSTINKLISKSDVVLPLAAIVGAPACDLNPKQASEINKKAAISIFKELDREQLLIMPTTNSAYGTTPEGQEADENSKLNPLSQYAKEKVEVEEEMLNYQNTVSFRLATVFGVSPRMRTDLLVNDLTQKAFTNRNLVLFSPNARRNYIHVRDVAKAILMAIDKPKPFIHGRIFNVGLTEGNMTKMELASEIEKVIGKISIIHKEIGIDPDQRDYLVSNKKIEEQGFKCDYSISDGIKELVKFYSILPKFNFGNI
jgi:nucleoside-diphosphate-sugar epimerase